MTLEWKEEEIKKYQEECTPEQDKLYAQAKIPRSKVHERTVYLVDRVFFNNFIIRDTYADKVSKEGRLAGLLFLEEKALELISNETHLNKSKKKRKK